MNWNARRVLVTGATGFIGSHLTETLVRSGARVRALDLYNPNSDWGNLQFLPSDILEAVDVVLSDVRDPFAARAAVKGCDVVFHLAALIGIPYSYTAPQSYIETNVIGTLNILEACRVEGVERIVHTSTSEAYGTACYTPIDEDHPLQAQSPYAASKIAADKLAESYFLSFDLPVAVIRPFNTYGPRQSARAIIPTVISQGLHSSVLSLGNLSPTRDLNYVEDTVRGFMAVAASDPAIGKVVNVGYGEDISIGELVELIGKVMGVSFDIKTDTARIRPENSEVMRLKACNKRALDICGWQPFFELREGIERTVEFMKQNKARFRPSHYNV